MKCNILNYNFDAIVDIENNIQNGSLLDAVSTYRTLSEALKAAPAFGTKTFYIYIKAGIYYEQIIIDKPNIRLVGANRDTTKLTFDAASGKKRADGSKYGTTGSSSITVTGKNFFAENITFENGFDYYANEYKIKEDPSYISGSQAVALKTAGDSNKATFINCSFKGYQDTLYLDVGLHFFKNCYIEGNVDFIFGAGQAFFEDCTIVSIGKAGSKNNGYITAPSTHKANKYGFVFLNCNILKANHDTADSSVALGRPWHPTTTFADGTRYANPDAVGSAVFIDCYMDSHIISDGWDKMSGSDANGNIIWFLPENLDHARFFEFESKGPGAAKEPSKIRKFLTKEEAEDFSDIATVLQGWLPKI